MYSQELLRAWNDIPKFAGGYTRVDPHHPLEIYIGWEDVHYRSLLLICPKEPRDLPSSTSILVKSGQRNDGKWAATFRLVAPEQEEVFIHLCSDLIESTRTATGVRSELFLDRYRRWHKLMERLAGTRLSEQARKGLVGELVFLRDRLLKGDKPVDVVSGWMGPESGDRDFVFGDSWYEIKAVGSSAQSVRISSLQQLDTTSPGRLILVVLDKTSSTDSEGFSLSGLVTEIESMLASVPTALTTFKNKLTFEFGYLPLQSADQDEPKYRLQGLQAYLVDGTFPRLVRQSVPEPILQATYDLGIAAIAKWRVDGGGRSN